MKKLFSLKVRLITEASIPVYAETEAEAKSIVRKSKDDLISHGWFGDDGIVEITNQIKTITSIDDMPIDWLDIDSDTLVYELELKNDTSLSDAYAISTGLIKEPKKTGSIDDYDLACEHYADDLAKFAQEFEKLLKKRLEAG